MLLRLRKKTTKDKILDSNDRESPHVDVYEDILSQLDTEYNIDKNLGDTIKQNLADRILSQSKKAIVQRHKLPENC